jgi:hypothetical protein
MAQWFPWRTGAPSGARYHHPAGRGGASRYTNQLVAKAGTDSFAVYSTRRQMLRYVDWYTKEADLGDVADLAIMVLRVLPETANEDCN